MREVIPVFQVRKLRPREATQTVIAEAGLEPRPAGSRLHP